MATANPYITPRYEWRTPASADPDWYTEQASMLSSIDDDLFNCSATTSAGIVYVETNSAYWDSTHQTVSSNSAYWNSTHQTVSAESADWGAVTSHVETNSAYWDSTHQTVSSNSAYWNSTHQTVSANSAYWNSTHQSVSANSGSWAGGGSKNYTPEYPGAVLQADGSSNVGTLTTGYDSTNHYTYYHWAGGAAAIQDYDIVMQLQMQANDWDTANDQGIALYYRTSNGTNTNCKIDVEVLDTGNTQRISPTQGWANTSWTQGTINKPAAGTWTEDSWITVLIKLSAKAGFWAEISQLEFSWET